MKITKKKSGESKQINSNKEKATSKNLFIDFLDSIYGSGYGIEFLEDNPDAFDTQLAYFTRNDERRRS